MKDPTTKEKFAAEGEEVKMLGDLLLAKGLLTRATHMIMLSPPLCITRAEVDRMLDIIDSSVMEVEKHYGYR